MTQAHKNILFIMESLNGGGAERVLIEILKNLDYTKYNIALCLVREGGVYHTDVPPSVFCFKLFAYPILYRYVKKITQVTKTDILLKKIINRKIKEKFDIVISFLEGPALKVHSLLNGEHKNITWVHTNLHSHRWHIKYFGSLEEERKGYAKMDCIVFVSSSIIKPFDYLFNNISTRKIVFYNPIDRERILKKSKEFTVIKDKLTICTIGRLEEQKAQDRLIRASKILIEQGFSFDIWILGSGQLEQNLKDLAVQCEIAELVKFWGFQKNPFPFLERADIFVNTSKNEGFPLVIAEAVCLGKAIVATSVAGTVEILENGKFGLVVGHSDDEIANGLKNTIMNPKLRRSLQKKTLERAAFFNISESMKQFENLIES